MVTVTELSLFSVIAVVKANTGVLPPLTSEAVQFPLILEEFELLEPQPNQLRAINRSAATANCFIRNPLGLRV